jgi:hypothetical protein
MRCSVRHHSVENDIILAATVQKLSGAALRTAAVQYEFWDGGTGANSAYLYSSRGVQRSRPHPPPSAVYNP